MTTPLLTPWPTLAHLPWRAIEDGLINATFAVGSPPVAVVQALAPIFTAAVNDDIDAVTRHIQSRGLETPLLLRTGDGATCATQDGRCWRALTWIPGETVHRLTSPEQAREAGALVGRWHRATADLDHAFAFARAGVHDTPAHMRDLESAVAAHPDHRLAAEAAPLAAAILAAWRSLPSSPPAPLQVCHGDLKVSNVRFREGRAVALVDLDTMGMQSLDAELGDAWRSWCNPRGEDTTDATLDLVLLEAAAKGYLAERPLPPDVREAVATGPERIALELAARFCRDALEERYFGFSPRVAPTRGDHNLLRARGQLALATAMRTHRDAIRRILAGA
ncbi:MAG: mucin desulfatase [Myxococcales bacterium]